jgi:dimethylhistidine N-methyltransferase
VDIAAAALREALLSLAARFPAMRLTGLCADYTRELALPVDEDPSCLRRAVYFPGSTVGNFTRQQARAFLGRVRDWVGAGGALVIGVDVKKSPAVLHAAYNDAAGVTAAFNLNLLDHVNRSCGADFDTGAFVHVAFYDEVEGRIEMHLRSLAAQTVTVNGRRFPFEKDELMRTEISCKYAIDEFIAMAADAGFRTAHVWQDEARLFAVYGLAAV